VCSFGVLWLCEGLGRSKAYYHVSKATPIGCKDLLFRAWLPSFQRVRRQATKHLREQIWRWRFRLKPEISTEADGQKEVYRTNQDARISRSRILASPIPQKSFIIDI